MIVPAVRSPWGVFGKRERSFFSRKDMSLPMSTTGWAALRGSPSKQSNKKPAKTDRAVRP